MSAPLSASTVAPVTLDVSQTPRVPLTRLVKVELRKMWDTRAGMWLLVGIGAATALVALIFLLTASEHDRTFNNMMQVTGTPQGYLLPVLGILLVTQEWGQRTGMVTFTLEPHRDRVLWAKVIAALIFGVLAFAIALALGAAGTALFGGPDAWTGVTAIEPLKYAIMQISGVLQGLAFGLLFLNSAGAIVFYFVVPLVFSIVTSLWSRLDDVRPWVDLATASEKLPVLGNLSGSEWAHVGTGTLIWVILPFVIGMWRVLRAEVK